MLLQPAYINGHERKTFAAYDYKLHPLTLGHIQLLAEMGSSIPFPGEKIEPTDIGMVVAVGMFSMWEEAREKLSDGQLLAQLTQRFIASPSEDQTEQVLAYIVYYLAKPRHRGQSDPLDSRCPWWWTYAEFMQTEMHRDEVAAWATPCCDAFAYYASFATRNGSDHFLTYREIFFADQIQQGKTIGQLFKEGVI